MNKLLERLRPLEASVLPLATAVASAATVLLIALAAALAPPAAAQTAEVLPHDWFEIRFRPADYDVTLDASAAFEGHYGGSVRRITPIVDRNDFGGFIQPVRAAPWRGKRIAMRAWIKTEQADSAQMWLRIDAADNYLAMDNMDNRPIKGTTGWALYEIVMDVPDRAEYLVYGVFLAGGGRVDIDNVQFLPAPAGAKTTNQYKEGLMKLKHGQTYTPPRTVLEAPSNLDFERAPVP